eukprot:356415-Chlamydomonas_euryale.AAC.3
MPYWAMYFAAKLTGGVRELGRDDRRASGGAVKPGPLGEDVLNVWVGTDMEESPMPSPVRGEGIQGGPGPAVEQDVVILDQPAGPAGRMTDAGGVSRPRTLASQMGCSPPNGGQRCNRHCPRGRRGRRNRRRSSCA